MAVKPHDISNVAVKPHDISDMAVKPYDSSDVAVKPHDSSDIWTQYLIIQGMLARHPVQGGLALVNLQTFPNSSRVTGNSRIRIPLQC